MKKIPSTRATTVKTYFKVPGDNTKEVIKLKRWS